MKKIILIGISLISFSAMAETLEVKCINKFMKARTEMTHEISQTVRATYKIDRTRWQEYYSDPRFKGEEMLVLSRAIREFCGSLSNID